MTNGDSNRKGNGDNGEQPKERIFIPVSNRLGGPILDGRGYRRFIGSTFFIWVLFAGFFWYFRVDLQASKELLTAIASASVEIAALSLTVLGVLHEFNKQDRWFKLGLFLVAILFGFVVLSGFFLVFTWRPEYDAVQHVTVIVVAFLFLASCLQVDWYALVETRLRPVLSAFPVLRKAYVRNAHLSVPFVLPFFLVFIPNVNRLTGILMLFGGAIIALLSLMGVTTYSLIRDPKLPEEDPVFRLSREKLLAEERAAQEIEILALNILAALNSLQKARQGLTSSDSQEALRNIIQWQTTEEEDDDDEIRLVAETDIINRLRQQDILAPRETLQKSIRALADKGTIYSENRSGPFWLTPDKNDIIKVCQHLYTLAIVLTHREDIWTSHKDILVESYQVTKLRDWLAVHAKIPNRVVDEYILPKALNFLLKNFRSVPLEDHRIAYVNYRWGDRKFSWEDAIANGVTTAIRHWFSSNRTKDERLEDLFPRVILPPGVENAWVIRYLYENGFLEGMVYDEDFQENLYAVILQKLPVVDDGYSSNSHRSSDPLQNMSQRETKRILHYLNPSLDDMIKKELQISTKK